jgi:hypothetical protein
VIRHSYSTSREKRIDLWVGFVGWLVINSVALAAALQLGDGPGLILVLGVLLADVGAPILFALTRGYVAVGIALAFGAVVGFLFAEAVFAVIGLFVTAYSGGLETNYCPNYETGLCIGSPAVEGALIVGCAVFLVPAFFVLRGIHQQIR